MAGNTRKTGTGSQSSSGRKSSTGSASKRSAGASTTRSRSGSNSGRNAAKNSKQQRNSIIREVTLIIVIGVCVLLLASLFVSGLKWLDEYSYFLFGKMKYLAPFFIGFIFSCFLLFDFNEIMARKLGGLLLIFFAMSGFLAACLKPSDGGLLGYAATAMFKSWLGSVGACIVYVIIIIIALILITQFDFVEFFRQAKENRNEIKKAEDTSEDSDEEDELMRRQAEERERLAQEMKQRELSLKHEKKVSRDLNRIEKKQKKVDAILDENEAREQRIIMRNGQQEKRREDRRNRWENNRDRFEPRTGIANTKISPDTVPLPKLNLGVSADTIEDNQAAFTALAENQKTEGVNSVSENPVQASLSAEPVDSFEKPIDFSEKPIDYSGNSDGTKTKKKTKRTAEKAGQMGSFVEEYRSEQAEKSEDSDTAFHIADNNISKDIKGNSSEGITFNEDGDRYASAGAVEKAVQEAFSNYDDNVSEAYESAEETEADPDVQELFNWIEEDKRDAERDAEHQEYEKTFVTPAGNILHTTEERFTETYSDIPDEFNQELPEDMYTEAYAYGEDYVSPENPEDYPQEDYSDAEYTDDVYTEDHYGEPVSGESYENISADSEAVEETVSVSSKQGEKAPEETREAAELPVKKEEYNKEYIFPPVDLLHKGPSGGRSRAELQQELQENADKLKRTLATFGVNVKITDVTCGPSVTRYEIQPEMGVKVSKIVSLTDDIKLNMAAADIRIEAPIPGKSAIGIEIPNKVKNGVIFRDLIESEQFKSAKSTLAFAAGQNIEGELIIADIAKMPHLLVAGTTGSGKSVCINTMIMSIIYHAKPTDVQMIMIDPKIVELSVYNGIPHLLMPVLTDPKKAANALQWAVAEMERRYQVFSDLGVRGIDGYNEVARTPGQTDDNGEQLKEMSHILIIADEFADLMMVASGDVETAICRLAQKARAAGMHLVLATQRPSVDVLTGLIKANIPSRIALKVSSGIDSRTILDMVGAEKLLGHGDMLYAPAGASKPVRIQGAFIHDDEIRDVVSFLKGQKNVKGGEMIDVPNAPASDASGGAGGSAMPERDDLFADAGRFVIEKEKASIGALQRAFRIGFNRAARIIDQLCDAGVVGEEEGTKPRRVLMKIDEFEHYLSSGE